METYLKDLGLDVQLTIINGQEVTKIPPIDHAEKNLCSYNSKSLHTDMGGFSITIKSEVMSCTTTKEVWDKFKTLYEGDDKVKQVKLQKYRVHFENLKINEKEDIATNLLRVYEVFNCIRGLREKIEDHLICKVAKFWITL